MRFLRKIFSWIEDNRLEVVVLLILVLITAGMRLYSIDQYMTFLGDEGRDAIIVKKIITQHDFPLLGPPTSIGNMYLGPLYYYMMAVAMTVVWLNPVGAAGMVAVIGTLTVGLVYFFAREWFGKLAALTAAFLYSISPVNIYYSRSSWNPNPAPFFALLALLGLHLSRKRANFKWFILTGASLAFAAQMHYLALILVPIFGLLWLFELLLLKKDKIQIKNFWFGAVGAIIMFLFLMSPLFLFDIRHNFINFRAITTFFTDRQTTVNLNAFNTIDRLYPIYSHDLIYDYITFGSQWATIIISILVLIPLILTTWVKFKTKKLNWSLMALGIWLLTGIGGLALYKQTIYPHYLGFLNPIPYLLLGGLLFFLKGYYKIALVAALIIGLGIINIQNNPLKVAPNNQLKRTQDVAKYVISESSNKPFNFALLSAHNYDAAYQYYLDLYGHKPEVVPFTVTNQLFVVCEDQVCQPINNAKYEIAAFGWARIDWQRDFEGVKIFRLVPNPDQKK